MGKHYRRSFVISYDAKKSYITYFANGMHIAYITADSRIFHENKAMTVEDFSKFNYSNYCKRRRTENNQILQWVYRKNSYVNWTQKQ